MLISAQTGAVDRSFPDVDDNVNVVLADGHGGWFAAGTFGCVGTVHVPGLVHLLGDGTLDRGWHAALPVDRQYPSGHPPAVTLALTGTTLVAGGSFGVEALAAATGARLWLAKGNGLNGVMSVAASTRAVYAGGDFTTIDGALRPSLAALDLRTGKLLDWHAATLRGYSRTPMVDAVALSGLRLYIGGNDITSIGGSKRPGFAALDARSGRLTSWVPATAPGLVRGAGVGDVETILVAGGEVFSAGHDGFGVTSARTGALEAWASGIHGVGYRFGAFGTTAYIGGGGRNGFDSVSGQSRNNLAAIDLASGQLTGWAPDIDRYVGVSSIAATRDEVLVGGGSYKTNG